MARGAAARQAWEERRDRRFAAEPEAAARWQAYWAPGRVEVGPVKGFEVGQSIATRAASGKVINALAARLPGLVGGSADLAPSNNTLIAGSPDFQAATPAGRNFRFGVREFAMGAMVNGLSIHGGLRAYGATFMVFSDYLRPAIRLAALMEAPSIFVLTHDSVLLGEDGPTHQPIEHLAALRAIPNLWVVRPADAGETAEAWELALNRHDGPTALVLSRQNLPVLDRTGKEGGVHARRLHRARRLRRRAAGHRLRGLAGPGGRRPAGRRGPQPAGGEPALLGGLLRPGRGLPPLGAGRGPARAPRWRPGPPSAGSASPRCAA